MRLHVSYSAKIPCDPGRAWQLLQDWGTIEQWDPDVASCEAELLEVGAERHLALKRPVQGLTDFSERIVAVGEKQFTYEFPEGFGPFPEILTTWRVGEQPPRIILGSTIKLPAWMVPVAPIVKRRWQAALKRLADGFARHCSD